LGLEHFEKLYDFKKDISVIKLKHPNRKFGTGRFKKCPWGPGFEARLLDIDYLMF
jgi:hypothetical protein